MRRDVYSYLREIYVHKISDNASVERGFLSWNRVESFLSAWVQNQALFMGISATNFVKLEGTKGVKDLYPVITQVLLQHPVLFHSEGKGTISGHARV
jgi:hypothetical protein